MSIIETARAWIAQDPDQATRDELEALIEAGDVEALQERFSGPMQFGTAGLRGRLGAGPSRMNRLTVSRATAGLCAWVKGRVPDARDRGICVGRDARFNSDLFERDVIEVAAGAGLRVWIFTDVVPTPVLAFAVLRVHAATGVMITASHNPPGYNGYKVYWENGAQIIPPNDAGIAREIEAAADVVIPRRSVAQARAAGLVREIDSVRDDYVSAIAAQLDPSLERAPVRVAYTALHGVAEETIRRVFGRTEAHDLHSVAEQAVPDGRFPTVAFPNPEEPGSMDRVLTLGKDVDADLVLANDPDGDRVAAAVRNDGGYDMLSGNDIGMLMADDLLRRTRGIARPLVLSTIVSSPMLGALASAYGATWEQTLTGHKWIHNRALELEQEGYTYVFGYEEALGYAPFNIVRDKDGIASALLLADMAARFKADGRTLVDAREALWRTHGFFADKQVSVWFEGPDAQARMNAAVDRVRDDPPERIGGEEVVRMLDLERQLEWTHAKQIPFTALGRSNVVILELRGGHRAMLRPSGTEPKLKFYFDAIVPMHERQNLGAAKQEADAILRRMVEDLKDASGC